MAHGMTGSQVVTAMRGGSPPPEMNVFEYLRVLYKYRWMVFVICTLAAVGTGAVCYCSRPRYTARTSLVPPSDALQGRGGLGMGMLSGGETALLRNFMNTSDVTDTYVGILESRAVADAIVERFHLANAYGTGGSKARARARLERNTDIRVSDKGIIHIQVVDDDRYRAAELANAYVEELNRQNKRLATGQAASKRAFLEARLQEVEQKLSHIDSLRSEDARVQEMLHEMLVRECEVAKIEEARSVPMIQVLDPAIPAEMRNPRGTIRKAALAALIALVCTMFLAFAREYVSEYRRRESLLSGEVAPAARPQKRALPDERRDGAGLSSAPERNASGEQRSPVVGMAERR
jgi:uncharacterized protein involved in exopolysaccharide biosynthesis